jgi:hypothetical protein
MLAYHFSHYYSRRCRRMVLELTGVINSSVDNGIHTACKGEGESQRINLLARSRGDHSLLYFAYTCVRDLFIGGVVYLAKKIIRWWHFTCKKPENIICDGILHVNMFHYFKIPYFTCKILQNLPTMNILDPIFYRTLFYDFRPVISPRARCFELKYMT